MKQFILIALLWAGAVHAAETKGAEALSDDLRGLLSQEMLELEKGMHSIFSNMVRGEYAPIESTALKIRDSFILKKNLTDAQRKELQKLPKAFIMLDQSFHEAAGDLANAAEFGDKEGVVTYYTQMSQKCVQCHSTYATHRFSSFDD